VVEHFEILQYGSRLPDDPAARYQLVAPDGSKPEPIRDEYADVARDLLRHGGHHPYFVDRSGGSVDGVRISWPLLELLQEAEGSGSAVLETGSAVLETGENHVARRTLADASCEIEFWAEPEGHYTFRVTNVGYEIKSGTVGSWDDARLEAVIDLTEPSGER
jgi:hypothetical protein